MSHPSLGPESSSLFGHLETLYPLACILTGPEKVRPLLRRVFERAAQVPPRERPNDQRAWLLELLLDEHGEAVRPGEPEDDPSDQAVESGDPLRQDVAERILEEALPTAVAACSARERFVLALDGFGVENASEVLATALDTTATEAEELRSGAWATLRANVREVLSPTEYSLVEEALSEEILHRAVGTLLADQFPRIPSSIRAEIRRTLQTTESTGDVSFEENLDSSDDSIPLSDRLPSVPKRRSLLGSLAILAVLMVIGVGIFFWPRPVSSPSSPRLSLVAFSAQQTDSVQLKLKTSTPAEAKAYVQSTWNRRVAVPAIEDAELQGVGHLRATSNVEVPAFLYAHPDDGRRITIFAYSYALLDQMKDQASLETDLRKQLAQSRHLVTHRTSGEEGLLWRNHDDIFVAVTSSVPVDSLGLRDRLRPGN